MKRTHTLFILILVCAGITAQAQNWERLIGNPDSCCITGCSVKQTASGSVYVAGNNFSMQPNKIILAKLSAMGDTVWTKHFGVSSKGAYAEYMNLNPDNTLIIAGYVQDFVNTSSGYLVLKTDTNGNEIWKKTYVNPDKNAQLEFIEATDDKGFIACGFITQPGDNANDFLTVKLDSLGNQEWERNYGFFENDAAHMIHQTADGGYVVSGDTRELESFNYDNYLIKLDKNGDREWDLVIGDEYNNGNQSLIIATDGDYVLCGEGATHNSNSSFHILLAKVSKTGELKWFKSIEGSGTEAGFFIIENRLKQYLITGYSTSYAGSGPYNIFLAKTDSDGNSLGVKYFHKPQISIGYDLTPANDGGYFIAGTTGSRLCAIHTFDENYTDTFSTSTIFTGLQAICKPSSSIKIYPNPAQSQVRIEFSEDTKTFVIYNAFGQIIKQCTTLLQNPIHVEISDWLPGLYFIRTENKRAEFLIVR